MRCPHYASPRRFALAEKRYDKHHRSDNDMRNPGIGRKIAESVNPRRKRKVNARHDVYSLMGLERNELYETELVISQKRHQENRYAKDARHGFSGTAGTRESENIRSEHQGQTGDIIEDSVHICWNQASIFHNSFLVKLTYK